MENPIKNFIQGEGMVPIIRTLGCLGDSLSSGEHESRDQNDKVGFHDYYDYSWGQFIARKCGLKALNFSKGGYTAADFFIRNDFPEMLASHNLCQAYIIALGCNDLNLLLKKSDYCYPKGFGNLEEAVKNSFEENLNTFVGCYVNVLNKIRQANPKCRIFLVTIPVHSKDRKELVEMKDKHAEFLRALPKYYEYLYILDLRKYAPDYSQEEFKNKYFLGSHLNAMGYKYTADMFITYIDYIINHNIEDFKQIGFVLYGNGVHNSREKW